tara:strand:+ start:2917 stop:4644 length:1728 start_codon:yes stop_codon:yes gene_type:complete
MRFLSHFWLFLKKKEKIFFFIIVFFSIIQVFLEMIGIAAAIPFVTFLLKPESLNEISLLSNFKILENITIDQQTTLIICLIFFSIFLIKNIVIMITNKIIYRFVFSFRTKLFSNLYDKILHQEFLFFVKKGISKIFNTTFNEVHNYSLGFVRPLIILLTEILISFGILILIMITGKGNVLLMIFPIIIVVALILNNINKSIKGWSETRIINNEKIINSNLNLINGIKEILIFGKIKNILNQFNQSLKSLEHVDVKNTLVTTYPRILLEQSVILIFIIIILLLSWYEKPNDEIIITLSFYLAASYRLVPSINKIFVSLQQLKFGKPSIPKIMEFYDLKKENKFFDDENFKNTFQFREKINLNNLNFGYQKDQIIIENLNLEIKKNEIIGIMGESGSGKSTLVNLLTFLLKPNFGKIMVDNKIVNNFDEIRKYQNLFSITSQDTYLIDGSIKDNIVFGSSEKIDIDRLDKSINFANLNLVIDKFSNGLDTEVGSTLKQLSSGQKQRIAIARAIYSDREFLIFDEATNALDENNEKIILKNISELKKNKTIVIISHNNENLKICDIIYKFQNKNLIKL